MPTLVVVGAQWGDEGKGKVTDYLSAEADTVVRYQGGTNAGHTVIAGGREYRLHLVPSGIVHGKVCVLGNGVVLDPAAFLQEMDELAAQGCDVGRVVVSDNAHLILAYHKALDRSEETGRGEARIGTTLRGVGPAYRDKAARIGVRAGDLRYPDLLRRRLDGAVAAANQALGQTEFHSAALADELLALAPRLLPLLRDTAELVNQAIDRGDKVLFEGAQGTHLDIDHGTYPFVTSSHPTAGGACIGSGVGPTRIDRVVGVAKAYTTRVGDGPFPSEELGPEGDLLRERGGEYGTTTGRPRRCGWCDVPVLRHAALVNGLGGLCVTKLDTLSGLSRVRIVVAYEHEGRRLTGFPHDVDLLAQVRPVYEEVPGWSDDLSGAQRFEDLPATARAYLDRVAELVGVPVVMVGVGAERGQTLPRESMF
ncbi:MAG TPA: adenylosuccinate synthase [Bacillota bacterium]|nr:adenylosuccinate synthase [Bacillota bacterium]